MCLTRSAAEKLNRLQNSLLTIRSAFHESVASTTLRNQLTEISASDTLHHPHCPVPSWPVLSRPAIGGEVVALLYSAIHRLYFDPSLNKQSNNQGLFMPNHLLSLFFSLLQQVLLRSSLVSSAVAFSLLCHMYQ